MLAEEFAPPSLDEWFRRPVMEIQKSSLHLDWTTVEVQIAKMRPCLENLLGPMTEKPTVNMVLEGRTRLKTRIIDFGFPISGEVYTSGTMNLVPSMVQTDGEWDSYFLAGFWSFSKEAFDMIAADIVRGDPNLINLCPKFRFHDPLLHQLLLGIANELEHDGYSDSLYVDSLAHAAMLHLLKFYSSTSKLILPQKGKLSFEQKLSLEEYIDAELANKITIAELARLLYISVPHLERCFRTSYGMPVYKFVLHRRIERAKALLLDGRKSLLDVAMECGFSNQSHFNRHFKTVLGISPRQFVARFH